MPIDYSQYPANWKSEVRPRILERDDHCCRNCGVANGAVGWRDMERRFHEVPEDGARLTAGLINGQFKPIVIVLTIAHLEDPDPMNCADDNLAALCQRCHLEYDRPRNLQLAKETRARKKLQGPQLNMLDKLT